LTVRLSLADNNLTGTIPPSVAGSWTQLTSFHVDGNHLTGPLPALRYGAAGVSDCILIYHVKWGSNDFTCPWPEGATRVCKKWDNATYKFDALVTDADCRVPDHVRP